MPQDGAAVGSGVGWAVALPSPGTAGEARRAGSTYALEEMLQIPGRSLWIVVVFSSEVGPLRGFVGFNPLNAGSALRESSALLRAQAGRGGSKEIGGIARHS